MKIIFKKHKGYRIIGYEGKDANNSSTLQPSYPTTRFSGFIATFLVMSAMIMMALGSLGAFSAAESYDDSVARREYRLVAGQNAKSCVSVALLAFAHDYFYTAQNQSIANFSCNIISASRNGPSISIMASSSDNGVTESISATAEDNGRSIDVVQ
jgi:hypothetical protein